MKHLNEATLLRLRDSLRKRGPQAPDPPPTAVKLDESAVELLRVTNEFGALFEAAYLMMAADGKVKNVEREVLKEALEVVTDSKVRGVYIEAMLDGAARRLATEGMERRVEAVVASLREDTVLAEIAFVLCGAVALADGVVHEKEQALLDALSDGLGISREKAKALVDEIGQEK